MTITSLAFERYSPYGFSVIGEVVWFLSGRHFPTGAENFLSSTLGFAGTLIGFLATAQAILMALPSESVMGQIKASGYIEDLSRYTREAFHALIVFAILDCVGFFLLPSLPSWYLFFWVFCAFLALATFYRIMRIMMLIMRRRS